MFAPVISWTTVCCIFAMALLLGWHMHSIDFIMAYMQAKVKMDIFMKLPTGTALPKVDPANHLLKLQENLWRSKDGQATRMSTLRLALRSMDLPNPKLILVFYQRKSHSGFVY